MQLFNRTYWDSIACIARHLNPEIDLPRHTSLPEENVPTVQKARSDDALCRVGAFSVTQHLPALQQLAKVAATLFQHLACYSGCRCVCSYLSKWRAPRSKAAPLGF